MNKKELPQDVLDIIENNLFNIGYFIAHFWIVDNVYFVLAKKYCGDVYCLKIERLQGFFSFEISNILYS